MLRSSSCLPSPYHHPPKAEVSEAWVRYISVLVAKTGCDEDLGLTVAVPLYTLDLEQLEQLVSHLEVKTVVVEEGFLTSVCFSLGTFPIHLWLLSLDLLIIFSLCSVCFPYTLLPLTNLFISLSEIIISDAYHNLITQLIEGECYLMLTLY